MSIEMLGAVNKQTAAIMALATTIEYHRIDTDDPKVATMNVEDRMEDHLDYLLEM